MAWRSHGRNNEDLVTQLVNNGILKTNEIVVAMKKVDRGDYVPPQLQEHAYEDRPLPIGYNVTISAPHMHAHCLELLKQHLKPGMRALDVGSGSGYLLAVMGHMVGDEGRAVGIEHIPELVAMGRKNASVSPASAALMSSGVLTFVEGDGRKGFPAQAPYDCIHVGAASPDKPKELIEQLAPGGRLVVPVGRGDQELMVYEKLENGKLEEHSAMGVRYVPLTSREAQLSEF
ncbi:hypothetical protein CYMTET_10397 [Cymbomonas tetramitiformis]|uniref:Protein-L-isoaspartate O-methyltransferase n=1 Tax=Cymbomonas tetramitiformis TaxID=36881 RepID=A0AAE0LDW2_9CHLO|nr:hypothetical protein CYMTET_10397 [Cymbomonas tetramitiformis]